MGPVPWVRAEPYVKTNVKVQWIYGMWPYCWQYGSCPLSECIRTVNLEWICNGYMACGRFGGTTATLPLASSHLPLRLVWMCNWYMACDRIVGTMGPSPWVVLKEESSQFPKRLQCKKRISGSTWKTIRKIRRGIGPAGWKMNQVEEASPQHVKIKSKMLKRNRLGTGR